MEASGIEVEGTDPFSGGEDWAGFDSDTTDPVQAQADAPADTTGLPVVDREGVVQPSALPDLTPEQAAAEAAAYREEKGEPAVPDALAQQNKLREIAQREAAEAAQQPQEAPAAPQEAPEQVAAPQESPAAPEEAPEPAPVVEDPTPPAATDGATAGPTTTAPPESDGRTEVADEDAPLPDEPTNAKGKVTHRRYCVLRVTDKDRYEKIAWYEKDGKMVQKGTSGAKRQTVAVCRGTDDALKIGYAALGNPQDGVKLVAVAALHFQEKTVRPKPPEPSRARLEIS